MIIRPDIPDYSIEITKTEGDEYHYHLRALINGLNLENDYLVFDRPQQFMKKLRALETSRSGRAELRGTEDFSLSFEGDGGSGALWIQLSLQKHFSVFKDRDGRARPGTASLEGGFSVSGEDILKIGRFRI